jgi:hypothetical protein
VGGEGEGEAEDGVILVAAFLRGDLAKKLLET